MTSMVQPSDRDRFMGAFIDIEDHMKEKVYGPKSEAPGRFRQLLESYASRHSRHLLDSQYKTLVTLSELRNLLAHNKYVEGLPVAVPSPHAVAAVEAIRDDLRSPSPVLAVLNNPKPMVASPEDTVASTLQTMYAHDFSQMPVYDGKTYVGLLTTNTVARWVADQMVKEEGIVLDGPVREALAVSETNAENILHRPRTLSVSETVWEFTTAAPNGTPVTALIITQNGCKDEAPLGIVVAEDLARLPH
jgi:CBS domain-containing protein